MNKKIVGDILKSNRKSNNLSIKDVAKILKDNGYKAADKTIYGWETGYTQPDADTLLFLCEFYNIDNVMETFGYHIDPSPSLILTKTEEKLVYAYREHPQMHEAIQKLLDIFEETAK